MPELSNPFVFERVELICQNADAKTLANYFHAQGWFIKLDNGLFKKALQTNNRRQLLTLIKSLPETMQDQIAADFSKVYAFLFSKNDNFAGLLGFLRDISKKEISASSELKYLDQVLYSLANFPTEFYQCYYFACQHEETQKLWTIRKDYYWESTALNGDLSKVIGKLEKEVQILFWEELRGNSLKTIAKEFNHKIYISFYLENYPQPQLVLNIRFILAAKEVHILKRGNFLSSAFLAYLTATGNQNGQKIPAIIKGTMKASSWCSKYKILNQNSKNQALKFQS